MDVFLHRKAEKYLERQNEPTLSRLLNGLFKLSNEPPEGDIKKLSGCNDYRLRIGDLRVIFQVKEDHIFVTNIAPRGEAYKE